MTQRKKPARKAPAKKPAKKAAARKAPAKRTRSPKARSETSPVDVMAQVRIPMALELRIKGKTFRDIAAELGVEVATAHGYVKRGLAELAAQQDGKAKELRSLELARLDALQAKLWPLATGDLTPLLNELRAKREELAQVDPKAAKKGALAEVLASLVDGMPQVDYVRQLLNVMKHRGRLLGLEAPVKHAATDPTGEEERQVPYAFPVPPNMTPEAWQAFAAKAAKVGQADG